MQPARIAARHGLGHFVVAVLLAGASACGGAGGQALVATEARVRSINQLLENGRYTDALLAADALVRSLHITPRGDLSDAGALALDALVEARWRNGDTSSTTLSIAERVVRWRQGHRDPRTPDSLGVSGRALVAAGRFDDAAGSFRAALRILEERPTRRDDRAMAEVLDGLAASLIEVAQYDEARPAVERALLIKRAGGMGGRASL
jgi:tetratricopeptide (TPR) repeat protein